MRGMVTGWYGVPSLHTLSEDSCQRFESCSDVWREDGYSCDCGADLYTYAPMKCPKGGEAKDGDGQESELSCAARSPEEGIVWALPC